MNRPRRVSKARAVLGAMSWRVPDDDWSSPWGFESEWIPPKKESAAGEKKSSESADGLSRSSSRSDAVLPRPSMAAREIIPYHVVLRFDDEQEVPDPPPPPPESKVVEAPAPAAKEQGWFRPSARSPLVKKTETPAAPALPEPARSYQLEPLPATPAHSEPAAPPPQPQAAEPSMESMAPVIPPAPPEPADTGALSRPLPPPEEHITTRPATVPNRPRSLPRRPQRTSWGSLVSLSLGTLGFTLLAWIYLYDAPRESDEDLRPQVAVDQTPATQAPVKLRAFLGSIVPVENIALRTQPAWNWDTPSLAAFVRSNGTALDNLRDLLEDYDWHPHHSDWYREDLSQHPGWAHVGSLLQAQAAYLARRGDEEPAFVAAIDLTELSRRLQDVWAWSGYMGRFQSEFTQCQPQDDLMRQACAAYYIHEKKLLLGPASGELLDTMPGGRLHQRPGRLFFKMNETLGLFAAAFRDLRDEMTRPPYTRLSVTAAPAGGIHLTSPRFYHPNSSGETYFSARIEPLLRLPQEHSLAQARHGLVRCLFAVRRHLAVYHTLPPQLSSLVPAFFSAVPQDPFSGEPLHYEPASGLLYSVGVNLIAEGGKVSQPAMEDDREPTLEIGIAMAAQIKK